MGSLGNGLLLGVRAGKAPRKLGDDGWNTLASEYGRETGAEPPVTPWGEKCRGQFLGFYVALGHEREQPGVPPLNVPIAIGTFSTWPAAVRRRLEKARMEWKCFSTWARERGYAFDPPQIWVVETEVA